LVSGSSLKPTLWHQHFGAIPLQQRLKKFKGEVVSHKNCSRHVISGANA